jgi:hypothetical protein
MDFENNTPQEEEALTPQQPAEAFTLNEPLAEQP